MGTRNGCELPPVFKEHLISTNMKKKNLSLIQAPLAVLLFLAIILAGAENLDGSCNIPWTLSWMAVAFILARLIKRLEDAK